MRLGRLRDKVAVQQVNEIDNGRGGRKPGTPPWLTMREVWAEIIPLRGDEALRNAVQRSVQLWRVTMRPFPGLTAKHRFLWGDIVLAIKSPPAPTELRDGIVMTCESGAGS